MRPIIKEIIDVIPTMNHDERTTIIKSLESIDSYEKIIDIIENHIDSSHKCPYCGSNHLHKHGKSAGLERYKCQSCNRTFNALTNTPLADMKKKELWLPYIQAMLDSKVLRKITETIDINLKTAFFWRHKFSQLLNKERHQTLSGIVEADETYFRASCKGSKTLDRVPHKRGAHKNAKRGLSKDQVCVLVATDRGSHSLEFITGFGAVQGNWLDKYFLNHISIDSILITDGLKSYVHFCNVNHITHEVVKNHKNNPNNISYHIQNVNSYHSRIKSWIIHVFHGVATKYLDHYLWWKHVLEGKVIKDSITLFKVMII